MGCNCSGTKANTAYEITYKDGTKEIVDDIATARIKMAKKGGTRKAIPRAAVK